ncbi:hypothetical protein BDA96_08G098800 [Sorghum bicolor]|uniref:Uncharacterized protein n=2 Tax=Sorghum bicolor TaxID=4558 RepID=A0A921U7L7_SORBI|nr:hypothetical protein BDA96_08G098800 [Sorghum bicolor]OQU92342.1 hypothetical protein SORBI_3001G329901 [Sorghum bicolor]
MALAFALDRICRRRCRLISPRAMPSCSILATAVVIGGGSPCCCYRLPLPGAAFSGFHSHRHTWIKTRTVCGH